MTLEKTGPITTKHSVSANLQYSGNLSFFMKEIFQQYFPGFWEIANLHPVAVHFPVALLTGFVLAELLSLVTGSKELRIARKWMLYFGTIGALVSVSLGLLGAEHVYHEGDIHGMMSKHRDYGLNVLALAIILTTWQLLSGGNSSGFTRIIQNFIGILLLVNLSLGSDLGALMVYQKGVAVKAVIRDPVVASSHHHNSGIRGELTEWIQGYIGRRHKHVHKIREHSH